MGLLSCFGRGSSDARGSSGSPGFPLGAGPHASTLPQDGGSNPPFNQPSSILNAGVTDALGARPADADPTADEVMRHVRAQQHSSSMASSSVAPTCSASTAQEFLSRTGDAHLPAVFLKVPLLSTASTHNSVVPTSMLGDPPDRSSTQSDALGTGSARQASTTSRHVGVDAAAQQGSTLFSTATAPMSSSQAADVTAAGGKRRLVPVWANTAACNSYALTGARDFSRILQRLAARDPLLVYVLQKAVNTIMAAGPASRLQPTLHVTADPTATIPSLLGLRVTGCWWQEDDGAGVGSSTPEPGVMLQLGVPYNADEVVPRVLRDYCTLSVLPTIVTVCTFEGRVLYQNAASLAYLGDFTWSHSDSPTRPNTQALGASFTTLAMGQQQQQLALGSSGGGGGGGGGGVTYTGYGGGAGGVGSLSGPGAAALQVPDHKNVLKQLFCQDKDALEDLQEELQLSNQWAGVVSVPANLKRHMRAEVRRARLGGSNAGMGMLRGGRGSVEWIDPRSSADTTGRASAVPVARGSTHGLGSSMSGQGPVGGPVAPAGPAPASAAGTSAPVGAFGSVLPNAYSVAQEQGVETLSGPVSRLSGLAGTGRSLNELSGLVHASAGRSSGVGPDLQGSSATIPSAYLSHHQSQGQVQASFQLPTHSAPSADVLHPLGHSMATGTAAANSSAGDISSSMAPIPGTSTHMPTHSTGSQSLAALLRAALDSSTPRPVSAPEYVNLPQVNMNLVPSAAPQVPSNLPQLRAQLRHKPLWAPEPDSSHSAGGLEWHSDHNILSSPNGSFTLQGRADMLVPLGLAPVQEVEDLEELDLELDGGPDTPACTSGAAISGTYLSSTAQRKHSSDLHSPLVTHVSGIDSTVLQQHPTSAPTASVTTSGLGQYLGMVGASGLSNTSTTAQNAMTNSGSAAAAGLISSSSHSMPPHNPALMVTAPAGLVAGAAHLSSGNASVSKDAGSSRALALPKRVASALQLLEQKRVSATSAESPIAVAPFISGDRAGSVGALHVAFSAVPAQLSRDQPQVLGSMSRFARTAAQPESAPDAAIRHSISMLPTAPAAALAQGLDLSAVDWRMPRTTTRANADKPRPATDTSMDLNGRSPSTPSSPGPMPRSPTAQPFPSEGMDGLVPPLTPTHAASLHPSTAVSAALGAGSHVMPELGFTSHLGGIPSMAPSNAGASVMGVGSAWHEITAIPLMDPVLDCRVLLITQTDVTKRVDVERRLAELTAAQMNMLEQMFPRHVIEHMLSDPSLMSQDVGRMANEHNMVTVMFCDVVGFTSMSRHISPAAVAGYLNDLYADFDSLIEEYGLYQLDTMGDCYIVAGGLVERDEDGFHVLCGDRTEAEAAQDAQRMVSFAQAVLLRAQLIPMPHNGEPTTLRIGCHSGRLVSGMLGTRLPKFTLFGDTMNTASRMESTCKQGAIQVSDVTRALLLEAEALAAAGNHASELMGSGGADSWPGEWTATGGVEIKGKGLMHTWVWTPADDAFSSMMNIMDSFCVSHSHVGAVASHNAGSAFTAAAAAAAGARNAVSGGSGQDGALGARASSMSKVHSSRKHSDAYGGLGAHQGGRSASHTMFGPDATATGSEPSSSGHQGQRYTSPSSSRLPAAGITRRGSRTHRSTRDRESGGTSMSIVAATLAVAGQSHDRSSTASGTSAAPATSATFTSNVAYGGLASLFASLTGPTAQLNHSHHSGYSIHDRSSRVPSHPAMYEAASEEAAHAHLSSSGSVDVLATALGSAPSAPTVPMNIITSTSAYAEQGLGREQAPDGLTFMAAGMAHHTELLVVGTPPTGTTPHSRFTDDVALGPHNAQSAAATPHRGMWSPEDVGGPSAPAMRAALRRVQGNTDGAEVGRVSLPRHSRVSFAPTPDTHAALEEVRTAAAAADTPAAAAGPLPTAPLAAAPAPPPPLRRHVSGALDRLLAARAALTATDGSTSGGGASTTLPHIKGHGTQHHMYRGDLASPRSMPLRMHMLPGGVPHGGLRDDEAPTTSAGGSGDGLLQIGHGGSGASGRSSAEHDTGSHHSTQLQMGVALAASSSGAPGRTRRGSVNIAAVQGWIGSLGAALGMSSVASVGGSQGSTCSPRAHAPSPLARTSISGSQPEQGQQRGEGAGEWEVPASPQRRSQRAQRSAPLHKLRLQSDGLRGPITSRMRDGYAPRT